MSRYQQPGTGRFLTADPSLSTNAAALGIGTYTLTWVAILSTRPIPGGCAPQRTTHRAIPRHAGTGDDPVTTPSYSSGIPDPGSVLWLRQAGPNDFGGGSGPSYPVQAGPKPPSGLEFPGFSQAIAALGNTQCASLIAGNSGRTVAQLVAALQNATVTMSEDPNLGLGPVTITHAHTHQTQTDRPTAINSPIQPEVTSISMAITSQILRRSRSKCPVVR